MNAEKPHCAQIPINLSMIFNFCTQFPQNWWSALFVNIIRSTVIQHVYCVPEISSPLS